MSDLQSYLQSCTEKIEETLDELLPSKELYPQSIHSLMRYSMFAGGKRIRPALLITAHESCGGDCFARNALYTGAAIEMLHTFSLIHDDLPCMDDDDFRRGKPTAHKAYSESLAVLGGDALCIFAYEVLSRTDNMAVVAEVSRCLGTAGMIGGQVVDIESEGKGVTLSTVEYIHKNKTAALIRCSLVCGALLAGASKKEVDLLGEYGESLGVAFQVIDDILDCTSSTDVLGKNVGSDLEKGKATWPALTSLEESRRYAHELTAQAKECAAQFGAAGERLIEVAHYLEERIH
ncbi:polyprenyl synthetase family protein [Chitinivibrio alkaliphilus]|uniref:Trans-isoprenyl diphosphate synthase n=1 Tax=Chitinivibrio alkaliphilus ACht1 TaxID=1313304 RepID=U7DDH7_9BACT|nr:farnesyl diphosphate synthase [Chitinivibrio alkaliphilus]ERP38941.1 trans-isoprenyl diphosphate synthase [Chitinivibrio alkaliphilus ACht1]